MTRLNIPRVTTLTAKGAFLNCRSLNNENFGDRLDQLIASMAAGGSLPDYMFYHMWGFSGGINGYGGSGAQRRVVVPEGVTTIGEQCFADFGFTVLDLPTTLTSIGKRALHNILVTSYIVSRATTPPSASTGFQTQFDFTKPLYVPRASISAYQAAGGWSSFTDIRALEDLTT